MFRRSSKPPMLSQAQGPLSSRTPHPITESDSSSPPTPHEELDASQLAFPLSKVSLDGDLSPKKRSKFLAKNLSKLAPYREVPESHTPNAELAGMIPRGDPSRLARPKLASNIFERPSGTIVAHPPTTPTPIPLISSDQVDPNMANLFAHKPRRRRGLDTSLFAPSESEGETEGARKGLAPKSGAPRKKRLVKKNSSGDGTSDSESLGTPSEDESTRRYREEATIRRR